MAPLTGELASCRLDGGVNPPCQLTLTSPFSRGTKDSSALSGISSMRGDFSFGSSTEELAAVRLTEESRANNVRPYGVPF